MNINEIDPFTHQFTRAERNVFFDVMRNDLDDDDRKSVLCAIFGALEGIADPYPFNRLADIINSYAAAKDQHVSS